VSPARPAGADIRWAMCLKEMGAGCGGGGSKSSRPIFRRSVGEIQGGIYSQFEGPARPPYPNARQILQADRRILADQPDIRAMVQHRQLNFVAGFFPARGLRCDFLPQRSDLLRSGHQDQHFHRLARQTNRTGFLVLGAPKRCRADDVFSLIRSAAVSIAERCAGDTADVGHWHRSAEVAAIAGR